MMLSRTLVALSSAVGTLAHGGVQWYEYEGKQVIGYKYYEAQNGQQDLNQRVWTEKPIYDPASPNVTCSIGETVPNMYHAPISAGAELTAHWDESYDPDKVTYGWPHSYGPMLAYMAECGGDCAAVDPAALSWFKIAETGLLPGYNMSAYEGWYQGLLFEQGWTVRVPASLRPGNYIIRHEIIMIELDPVQLYPQCAHFTVEGDGTATPGPEYLVKLPGAYSVNDPGIAWAGKMYTPEAKQTTSYPIPGPKVWEG